ncbi:Las1-like-domain-containing protein [Cunninghamella echinulata]|nr:Las1-like-domain-containing protein [Cunninghamella echinulata]
MPRVVPWINNHELCQVFNWLYSDINEDPKLAQRGVDRVKAWISRGKVPISVRSTMDLVEVQLREQKCQHSQIPLSENELRQLYCSVFIRFINGIEDSRQKGYYAKSLLSIADEIGLPIWLVQVRHAATHGDLPTLYMLRRGCIQALQWLYDNYWVLEINPEALQVIDEKTNFKLRTLLNYYKISRKAYLKGEQNQSMYMKTLDNFFKAVSPNIIQECIIPLIIGAGGIVPTSIKKRVTSDLKLPDQLIALWMPLLEGMSDRFPNFIFELICAIVNELDNTDNYMSNENLIIPSTSLASGYIDQENEKKRHPTYPLTLACWLRYFITQSYSNKPLFYNDIVEDIMELCLKRPNSYSEKVLQAIVISDPILGKSIEPFLHYINSKLMIDLPSNKLSTETTKIDIENEINQLNDELSSLKRKLSIKEEKENNLDEMDVDNEELTWTLVDKKSWAACPIGCLPNGEVPDLYLDV